MTEPQLVVHVNLVETTGVLAEEDVRRAVFTVVREEGVESGEISVTFLDRLAISALNEAHLEHDGPTDVISFNLTDPYEPLGDVYVCTEIARESAHELGIGLREELLRLVVHGVLHVVGYDHPDGPERLESEMFQRQEVILSQLL